MTESSENIEVVTPGQLLKEARQKAGMSIKDVAEKLNLRRTIIEELESDKYDPSVSPTFTRGYLKLYAKVVSMPEDVVLASYEHQDVAQRGETEMQSFSRRTSREASESRLMMVSYVIVLLVIGLSFIWWWQKPSESFSFQRPTLTQSDDPAPSESTTVTTEILEVDQLSSEAEAVDDSIVAGESENVVPEQQAETGNEENRLATEDTGPELSESGNAETAPQELTQDTSEPPTQEEAPCGRRPAEQFRIHR